MLSLKVVLAFDGENACLLGAGVACLEGTWYSTSWVASRASVAECINITVLRIKGRGRDCCKYCELYAIACSHV